MKRIVNIAKNNEEARQWDIKQLTGMSHEERQQVVTTLRKRVFGDKPDVREWERRNEGKQ